MSFFPMTPEIAPDRMVPKGKKDKDYHRRMGRFCIAAANTGVLWRNHIKGGIAERAYDDQIITTEDIDTYLVDESKQSRNRVFFTFNTIKPVIEQHRGTMLKSQFNASVFPVTHRTNTRKQIAMAQQMLTHEIAQTSEAMRHIMGQRYNLGKTMDETIGMFDSSWSDAFGPAMNHLVQQSAKIAFEGDDTGMEMLQYLCYGITCGMFRPEGSFVRWRSFHPKNLIYDTRSERLDFADARWMGLRNPMDLPLIAESFPKVSKQELQNVEDHIRMYSGFGTIASQAYPDNHRFAGNLQNHSIVWNDVCFCELGYINGIGGVPTLVKVNYDEGDGKNPQYTYNDLIPPPDNAENKELFGQDRYRRSTVECTRFIDFVPWEYMVGAAGGNRETGQPEDLPDLVLDYGLYPLQEYNPLDPMKTANPIKAYRYGVADGETVTPVQAMIDPNRYLIRMLSGFEGQVNVAGTKGTTLNEDYLSPSNPPAEAARRIKSGETVFTIGPGNAAQAAVGSYDASPGQGTFAMLQVIREIHEMVRITQGTPSAIQEPKKNQTTGVTEIVTENSALMHEAIYDGYQNLQLQKWKHLATAGKEWYLEREDVLLDLIDERDYIPLLLSEEVSLERLNAKVDRDNPDQVKRQQVNLWLDALFASGAIPPELYFDLYNKSYFEEVSIALRLYSAQLKQAQIAAEEEAKKQQVRDGIAMKAEQLRAEKNAILDKQADGAQKLAEIGLKSEAAEQRERVKADLAPPKPSPKPGAKKPA